jgi:hypothetical protein
LTARQRERGLTPPAGGPTLTLKIHPSAPATITANPVVTLHGGTFVTGQSVTMSSSTPGAIIHWYQFNALFAPPPSTSTFFSGPSPATAVVNINSTLYCYATATGLADSAMVQEDYEGPK